MDCKACGAQNPEMNKYCQGCGKELTKGDSEPAEVPSPTVDQAASEKPPARTVTCPACKQEHLPSEQRCKCGYTFTANELKPGYSPKKEIAVVPIICPSCKGKHMPPAKRCACGYSFSNSQLYPNKKSHFFRNLLIVSGLLAVLIVCLVGGLVLQMRKTAGEEEPLRMVEGWVKKDTGASTVEASFGTFSGRGHVKYSLEGRNIEAWKGSVSYSAGRGAVTEYFVVVLEDGNYEGKRFRSSFDADNEFSAYAQACRLANGTWD